MEYRARRAPSVTPVGCTPGGTTSAVSGGALVLRAYDYNDVRVYYDNNRRVSATDNTIVIIPALSLRVKFNATMPSSQAIERRDTPFATRWFCLLCDAHATRGHAVEKINDAHRITHLR